MPLEKQNSLSFKFIDFATLLIDFRFESIKL